MAREARLSSLFFALLVAGVLTYAHEGFEHVRGVVKGVSDYTVTVEAEDKTTPVLALTPRTTIRKDRKRARLRDLMVGDRVVIEVPNGTRDAGEIQIEPAKTPVTRPPSSARK